MTWLIAPCWSPTLAQAHESRLFDATPSEDCMEWAFGPRWHVHSWPEAIDYWNTYHGIDLGHVSVEGLDHQKFFDMLINECSRRDDPPVAGNIHEVSH